MMLLKKNGSFPVINVCKIALFEKGARNTQKGGTGSGDVNVCVSSLNNDKALYPICRVDLKNMQ